MDVFVLKFITIQLDLFHMIPRQEFIGEANLV